MSRSQATEKTNPADKFFEWAGGTGEVTYYDKTQEKNIVMPLPFKFLVLDRVAQITGGIDTDKGYLGYWSNAVKNVSTQPFVVKSKNGTVVEGLYKDIKSHVGVKFMTGLYIAYKEDVLKIGYFKIKGASLSAWIEFTQNKNIFQGAFSIVDRIEKKKGSNKYFEPVFSTAEVSDETNSDAIALDLVVQEYMVGYFGQPSQTTVDAVDEEFDDDIPF